MRKQRPRNSESRCNYFINMKNLRRFNFIAVVIGFTFFFSCEKEDSLLLEAPHASIPTFKTVEKYTTELNNIANMTLSELTEYEKRKGFYSLGRKCDETYQQANPENFNNKEDFIDFVKINSDYIELVVDAKGDTTLEIKSGYNSNRYLANEDGLFRINSTLYKVINNFTIYSNNAEVEKLKNINEKNYHEYKNDSDIKIPNLNDEQIKTSAEYFHKTKEKKSGNNKTKLFITMWGVDHYQNNDTYLQCDFVVRPYKRSLGVWLYCSRTLSWDLTATIISNFNDIWAGWNIDENEDGKLAKYSSHTWTEWLDNGLDHGGYSVIKCCFFHELHYWGSSPATGPVRIDINPARTDINPNQININ